MAQKYLNRKQELFCRFIAGGETQGRAYELAGYEPSSANASTLFHKPIIQQRISELKAEAEREEIEFRALRAKAEEADPEGTAMIAKGVEWTFQRVMDMMAETVRLAQIAGEYKAANEALKMMAEAMRMFDHAKGQSPEAQRQNNQLTLIKEVTNILSGTGPSSDEDRPANPLKPSRQA